MRKITLLLLLPLLMICTSAWGERIDGLSYNLNTDNLTAEVAEQGAGAVSGNITIPETFTYNGNTYTVTSIADQAFQECGDLISIDIPSTVTRIGDKAFESCLCLAIIYVRWSDPAVCSYGSDIFFMAGVPTIYVPAGTLSAYQNTGPWSSFTIEEFSENDGLKTIDGILYNIESTNYTASVAKQGSGTVSGDITIPDTITYNSNTYTVTSLADEAFSGCTNLTSISIPASVTSIGSNIFCRCDALETITVASGNSTYDSRDNCNAIIHTESDNLIAGCKNTVIPNTVTSIGSKAFYGCIGLTSITIPDSVTSIGEQAFYPCCGLKSVTIPSSVSAIGNYAFCGCTALDTITLAWTDPSVCTYRLIQVVTS